MGRVFVFKVCLQSSASSSVMYFIGFSKAHTSLFANLIFSIEGVAKLFFKLSDK